MVRWEAKRIKRALQSHVNLLYRAIFHESFQSASLYLLHKEGITCRIALSGKY